MECFSIRAVSAVSVVCVDNTYLTDVTESIEVWHRGGFVSAHNYFPCLLFELHTQLVQAQGFGFRGSAWGQWKETTQGEYYITTQERVSVYTVHNTFCWGFKACATTVYRNLVQELRESSKAVDSAKGGLSVVLITTIIAGSWSTKSEDLLKQ